MTKRICPACEGTGLLWIWPCHICGGSGNFTDKSRPGNETSLLVDVCFDVVDWTFCKDKFLPVFIVGHKVLDFGNFIRDQQTCFHDHGKGVSMFFCKFLGQFYSLPRGQSCGVFLDSDFLCVYYVVETYDHVSTFVWEESYSVRLVIEDNWVLKQSRMSAGHFCILYDTTPNRDYSCDDISDFNRNCYYIRRFLFSATLRMLTFLRLRMFFGGVGLSAGSKIRKCTTANSCQPHQQRGCSTNKSRVRFYPAKKHNFPQSTNVVTMPPECEARQLFVWGGDLG